MQRTNQDWLWFVLSLLVGALVFYWTTDTVTRQQPGLVAALTVFFLGVALIMVWLQHKD